LAATTTPVSVGKGKRKARSSLFEEREKGMGSDPTADVLHFHRLVLGEKKGEKGKGGIR